MITLNLNKIKIIYQKIKIPSKSAQYTVPTIQVLQLQDTVNVSTKCRRCRFLQRQLLSKHNFISGY